MPDEEILAKIDVIVLKGITLRDKNGRGAVVLSRLPISGKHRLHFVMQEWPCPPSPVFYVPGRLFAMPCQRAT